MRSRSFPACRANLNINGELERVFAVSANADALRMLGADPPALGRLLDDATDFAPDGRVSAVVISDGLWRRHFGADPAAVGRHIEVNNIPVQIAGVLRPGLKLFLPASTNVAEDVDVWFPDGMSDRTDTRNVAVARLAAGVTLAQANAELATMGAGYHERFPQHFSGTPRFYVESSQDRSDRPRQAGARSRSASAVAFVLADRVRQRDEPAAGARQDARA